MSVDREASTPTTVEAGERKTLRYEIVEKKGDNAEQDRVTLEAGAPAPVLWAKE